MKMKSLIERHAPNERKTIIILMKFFFNVLKKVEFPEKVKKKLIPDENRKKHMKTCSNFGKNFVTLNVFVWDTVLPSFHHLCIPTNKNAVIIFRGNSLWIKLMFIFSHFCQKTNSINTKVVKLKRTQINNKKNNRKETIKKDLCQKMILNCDLVFLYLCVS